MLWYPSLSKSGFTSVIRETDQASTGKWLVEIPIGDPEKNWERIVDEVFDEDRIIAVKKSTNLLSAKIGHDLACVYCPASDEETVSRTLEALREIGIEGDLRYKSDKATVEGRDEYLWSSTDLEQKRTPGIS